MRSARVASILAAMRKLPLGALTGCVIVAAVHLVVSVWVYPQPVAPDYLRDKVIALTQTDRPGVLVAGDSRAGWHVIPEVVADVVGVWPEKVVNVAVGNGDGASTLAAYREFEHRFATSPIMLLSISFWSVNDHPNLGTRFVSDATLGSMGLWDRLRVVPRRRVVASVFSGEMTLWRRIMSSWKKRADAFPRRGFEGVPKRLNVSPDEMNRRIQVLKRAWYAGAKVDGLLWSRFERSVQDLIDAGVQVVILDTPEHPAFLADLEGTPEGRSNRRFHQQLAELGERLEIPVLAYGPDRFATMNPSTIYCNLLHLNCSGATLLSEWVGQDLKALIDQGKLHLEAAPIAVANRE